MAIETTGVFGSRTTQFLKELGQRLRQVSGEANSYAYPYPKTISCRPTGQCSFRVGDNEGDSDDEEFFV